MDATSDENDLMTASTSFLGRLVSADITLIDSAVFVRIIPPTVSLIYGSTDRSIFRKSRMPKHTMKQGEWDEKI